MTSPSGFSPSSCLFPFTSSTLLSFCACSMPWGKEERKQQKSVSYARGSCCTLFRDGAQYPSGPRWPCGKAHMFPNFNQVGCHLKFQIFFYYFWRYKKGQIVFNKASLWQQTSVHLTVPPTEELCEYNSAFYYFIKHQIFSKKNGIPFLDGALLLSHTTIRQPHVLRCLGLVLRVKWEPVNVTPIVEGELSITWKLHNLIDSGW